MTEQVSTAAAEALATGGRYLAIAQSSLNRIFSTRRLAAAAFLLGATVMLIYRPFSHMEIGDSAIYDYIAQSILRGQVPYRDVVDIKGPGSVYMSAMAMAAGKAFGVRDILAVRLFHVLLVALLSTVTYLVAESYLRNRAAATVSFLVPLMTSVFARMMVEGTQPKLPMILFGMLSLLLVAKDRPFWAGLCSMLSCICWQPGLLFTGVVILMSSQYLTSWRDLRAIRALLGAALPLAVVLVSFYLMGALADLWSYAITYNYSVFGPRATRTLGRALAHLWKITRRVLEAEIPVVVLSLVGLVLFTRRRVRVKLNGAPAFRSPDLFRDAIIFPPIVYLIFSLINFQSGPDFIPFFPFVGIFTAWFLVELGRLVGATRLSQRLAPTLRLDAWVPGLAAALMLPLALARGLAFNLDSGWTLKQQDKEFKPIAELLGPEDRVYVHGTVEILVLLNRPNLNPYVFMDWGMDEFIAAKKYQGSFGKLVDEMEAQAPKIVGLSRLGMVTYRAELERWVAEHYDKLELPRYEIIYIRKHGEAHGTATTE